MPMVTTLLCLIAAVSQFQRIVGNHMTPRIFTLRYSNYCTLYYRFCWSATVGGTSILVDVNQKANKVFQWTLPGWISWQDSCKIMQELLKILARSWQDLVRSWHDQNKILPHDLAWSCQDLTRPYKILTRCSTWVFLELPPLIFILRWASCFATDLWGLRISAVLSSISPYFSFHIKIQTMSQLTCVEPT